MSLGSYIRDECEVVLVKATQDNSVEHINKLAQMYREEVQRADNNAKHINELKQQIFGMKAVINIYAGR
jgi:hypothetical protein